MPDWKFLRKKPFSSIRKFERLRKETQNCAAKKDEIPTTLTVHMRMRSYELMTIDVGQGRTSSPTWHIVAS